MKERNNEIKQQIYTYAKEHGLEEGREPIVDGITNPELYIKARLRILFILKEAYDGKEVGDIGDGGWDHAEHLNGKDSSIITGVRTHQRVSKIASCILRDCSLEDYESLSWDDALYDFKSIAWINVGKFPAPDGTRTSKTRTKQAYAYWKPVLFRQIDAYDPDIIFFGNTFGLFENDLKDGLVELNSQWPTKAYKDKVGRLLIDAYHPAVRTVAEADFIDSIMQSVRNFDFKENRSK